MKTAEEAIKNTIGEEMLKIEEASKHLNITIQFYNGECNIYVNRPDDDSEMTSIGGYDDFLEALYEINSQLKRRLKPKYQ